MTIHTSPSNVTLDRQAARAAIIAAAGRFTALLREIDHIERPAAGTDWTVAETAAHASCVLTGLSATIAGELPALKYPDADFPTRLAASNAASIAMVDQTDPGRLAQVITVGTTVPGARGGGRSADGVRDAVVRSGPDPHPGLPHRPGAGGADCARVRHRDRDGPAVADLRGAREAHRGHGVPGDVAAGGAARGSPRRADDVRGPAARRRSAVRHSRLGRGRREVRAAAGRWTV